MKGWTPGWNVHCSSECSSSSICRGGSVRLINNGGMIGNCRLDNHPSSALTHHHHHRQNHHHHHHHYHHHHKHHHHHHHYLLPSTYYLWESGRDKAGPLRSSRTNWIQSARLPDTHSLVSTSHSILRLRTLVRGGEGNVIWSKRWLLVTKSLSYLAKPSYRCQVWADKGCYICTMFYIGPRCQVITSRWFESCSLSQAAPQGPTGIVSTRLSWKSASGDMCWQHAPHALSL